MAARRQRRLYNPETEAEVRRFRIFNFFNLRWLSTKRFVFVFIFNCWRRVALRLRKCAQTSPSQPSSFWHPSETPNQPANFGGWCRIGWISGRTMALSPQLETNKWGKSESAYTRARSGLTLKSLRNKRTDT